jgi:hypothetical protein
VGREREEWGVGGRKKENILPSSELRELNELIFFV